jgi:hypothetical protein
MYVSEGQICSEIISHIICHDVKRIWEGGLHIISLKKRIREAIKFVITVLELLRRPEI